ncbi:MAG: restriction endonuclease subunit S [Gammaproteobacteria bacterium]|nr:restriction endonuclease subunit S [Gammaproteobacteria bacterium]
MAAELKPYSRYKDSGVEWLGEVPAHWAVERLKASTENVVDQSAGPGDKRTIVGLEHVESWTGRVTWRESDWSVEGQLKQFRSGDVLFGKLRPYLAKVTRLAADGLCVGEFLVLRPRQRHVNGAYLEHLLRSKPIIDAVNSSTFGAKMPRADWRFVGGMPVVCPPFPEQATIVRFLDHADRRIRRYIRAKQKLIALLEEQKQAIIFETATGRIDVRTGRPYPGYEDTDVKWLGAVPAHWEVMRVKQVSRVLRGAFTHRPRNDPSLYDGPYPFIQTGEVAGADKRISSYRQTLNDRGLAVSRMFPAGTLVMAIAANIGDVAVLDFEACFPDSVVGFVPGDKIERDFLYYVFRAMRPELLRKAPVNTQGNLNVDRVGSRRIPIPPHDEQRSVVRKIETNTVRLNAAIRQLECGVDLLREFRTRLVADVVTGKLDVREAAAGLSDLDLLATDEDPNDDFNLYARSEANGDAEEGGPGPDVVDAERSDAAGGELITEGG